MIYKSFFRKRTTKIYLVILLIISFILSFLLVSRKYYISKSNEAYEGSYIYFISDKNIDLKKEKSVIDYNKTILLDCDTSLTRIFISKDEPIISIEESVKNNECIVEKYRVNYTISQTNNIVQNGKLYDYLDKINKQYVYFVKIENWFYVLNTVNYLEEKYDVNVEIEEYKIDSNEYNDILLIYNVFILILDIFLIIIFIFSILNIYVDEKRNNYLYYVLGYSKLKILKITINKILLLLIIPLIFCIISIIMK